MNTAAGYERIFDLWRWYPEDGSNGPMNPEPWNTRQIASFLRDEVQLLWAGQVEPVVYVVRLAA
jgi:hypothetical protein